MMYLIVRGGSVVAFCDSLQSAFVFGVHAHHVYGSGVSIRSVSTQDGGGWIENSEYVSAITPDHSFEYHRTKTPVFEAVVSH